MRTIISALAAVVLAACGGNDPVADDANKIDQAAEIDVLPPDESAATPSEDLANGAIDPPANAADETAGNEQSP